MAKIVVTAIAVALLVGIVGGIVCAAQVSEGQVVVVADWVLTIKTQSGESVAFTPRWVQENKAWLPGRPVRNFLAALEPGETVRVTWTADEKENRRRIDTIEVTSALRGTTKGIVVRTAANELVIKPQEKPGTVTFNTKFVQVDGKWVPDPDISPGLLALKPGAKITVNWEWDKEGRKRIHAVREGW